MACESRINNYRRKQAFRIANGICTSCKINKANEGMKTCQSCLDYLIILRKKRKTKKGYWVKDQIIEESRKKNGGI